MTPQARSDSMAKASSHFPEPDELNGKFGKNYLVLKLIAAGGMGAVYKARHTQLDRFVAIKILPPTLVAMAKNSEFDVSQRFEQEAKAMAKLVHSNIVGVHDFGETEDGILFLVMEFVDGENIQTLLHQSTLAVEHVLTLARQICGALAYSHDQGMVHRDVKPGNILIDHNGKAKVTDFGLVKVMGSNLFETKIGFGTPGYYAPEIEKNGTTDERSDIYSFGVLLYEMLTSELPVGLWEPVSMLKPELDERFDQIVGRCLKRRPEDRYQSMHDVKMDLDAIAFGTPDGKRSHSALNPKQLFWRLFIVYISLFLVSGIASAFDIYFNRYHIGWLLEQAREGQRAVFDTIIARWNLICYLILPGVWAWIVFSLFYSDPNSPKTRSRLVKVPFRGAALCALGWFASIPGLLLQIPVDFILPNSTELLLIISVLIKAGISIPLGFLVTDLLVQRLLYPHFFPRNTSPLEWGVKKSPGLELRGILWIISSSVCPILALLLLVVSINSFDIQTFEKYQYEVSHNSGVLFAPIVALMSIGCVLLGVLMFRHLVVLPVKELRQATQKIRDGIFDVHIESFRTDELGDLAQEFNRMASGLREKEHLRTVIDQNAENNVAKELKKRDTSPKRTKKN